MYLRSVLRSLPGVLVLLLPAAPLAAAEKHGPPDVAGLIEQLGSNDFQSRADATRALDALGPTALPELRKAADSDDLEVRRRALDLVRNIEKRVQSAQLLVPKQVHLVYKDTPVADAVADFGKQTGFNLVLAGDRNRLAGRKVTLDTGTVSFWEAFDRFCARAGLAEPSLVPDGWKQVQAGQPNPPPAPQGQQMLVRNTIVLNPYGAGAGADFSRLLLVDGAAPVLPTCRAGALRVRSLPAHVSLPGDQPLGEKEKVLPLEVAPEPGMSWGGVVSLRITRAVDDRGQHLPQPHMFLGTPAGGMNDAFGNVQIWDVSGVNPSLPGSDPRQVPVCLKLGAEPGRKIKELQGVVTAQVRTPLAALLSVDDVLRSAGKTVEGAHGGWLKVIEVNRSKQGQVELRVHLDPPRDEVGDGVTTWAGGGRAIMINRAVMRFRMMEAMEVPNLELRDARGQPFQRTEGAGTGPNEFRLTFTPNPGQAEAAQLVFLGQRTVVIEVPFALQDVPLP